MLYEASQWPRDDCDLREVSAYLWQDARALWLEHLLCCVGIR